MPATSRLDRLSGAGFRPVFAANLLPLVGVFGFGWDPATLLVVYVLELLVAFPIAGAKAVFAGRPPRTGYATDDDGSVISVRNELAEKRGSVEAVPWLPPVYPRNLPFAAAVLGAGAWFAIVAGIVLSDILSVADALARPDTLASALALVVGQAAAAVREYRDGGYRTASPYSVVETPARQTLFVVGVVIVTAGTVPLGVDLVLGVAVLAKLVVEWSGHRAGRGDGGRLSRWLSGPDGSDGADAGREPPAVPDAAPDARVPTDARTVLWTGAFDVVGRRAPWYWMTFVLLWLVILAVVGGQEPSRTAALGSGGAVAALFVGTLAARVGLFYLRYARVEYRRYGDRLVAHDTLLSEPQWATPIGVLRDAEVVADRLPDRLFSTRTIAVTTGSGDDRSERYLGPVADPDRLVDVFELPVRTTSLAPLNRLPAAATAACLDAVAAAILTFAVGSWISAGELVFDLILYGVFGVPIGGLALRLLWAQSYPDGAD